MLLLFTGKRQISGKSVQLGTTMNGNNKRTFHEHNIFLFNARHSLQLYKRVAMIDVTLEKAIGNYDLLL